MSTRKDSFAKRARETAMQALQLGVAPWLSWWLASQLMADAPLVGPYLLVSPLIAFAVVGLVWSPKLARDIERAPEPKEADLQRNPEIEALAAIYAAKAGLEATKVFCYKPSHAFDVHTAKVVRGGLHVQPDRWEALDEGERRFVIARAVAELHRPQGPRTWHPAVSFAIIIGGGIVACYNLWLILPMHVVAFGVFMWRMVGAMRASILQPDRQALMWTGDLDSALRYLRRAGSHYMFLVPAKKREAALREAARDLQAA